MSIIESIKGYFLKKKIEKVIRKFLYEFYGLGLVSNISNKRNLKLRLEVNIGIAGENELPNFRIYRKFEYVFRRSMFSCFKNTHPFVDFSVDANPVRLRNSLLSFNKDSSPFIEPVYLSINFGEISQRTSKRMYKLIFLDSEGSLLLNRLNLEKSRMDLGIPSNGEIKLVRVRCLPVT